MNILHQVVEDDTFKIFRDEKSAKRNFQRLGGFDGLKQFSQTKTLSGKYGSN